MQIAGMIFQTRPNASRTVW
ncbi:MULTISPECIES: hypothetical protein [Blautia]|nr:hypothetical protein [Blautia acetigignens]MEE0300160.1 hypothetical protein [Blautia sp.]